MLCTFGPDCIGILCFALTGVVFVQTVSGFCVLREVVLFFVQTASVFSLLCRLGCVHPHELHYHVVICVGMCSFVWRGISGCFAVFSRSCP